MMVASNEDKKMDELKRRKQEALASLSEAQAKIQRAKLAQEAPCQPGEDLMDHEGERLVMANARQILVRLTVSGDLAGLTDEQLVQYAAAHLQYEGVHGLSEEQERKLDNADFTLEPCLAYSAVLAARVSREGERS